MLKRFQVKNYKNFRDAICIDFTNVHDYRYNEYCVKNGLISKMLIYGKNAVGKSNLGSALFDITLMVQQGGIFQQKGRNQWIFKNADAGEKELVEFSYSFQLEEYCIDYEYKKRDIDDVVCERLVINDRVIFDYNLLSGENDFSKVGEINAGDLNWLDFWNMLQQDRQDKMENFKPTALRYIIYNTIQKEGSPIYKLAQFVQGMRYSSSNQYSFFGYYGQYFNSPEAVSKFEKFLNDYGVACKLVLLEQADGTRDLYFDYEKPLLFGSNLSSGTLALTLFYIQFLYGSRPSFIYLDEFDAYYHYELSEKIIAMLEHEFECQVVITSHNTNLLSNSIMRPDCFMILNRGRLTPICEATQRELRQGHNLEKLYVNGEFDG